MMKAKKTREEVLTKFQTAKEKKKECLVQLEKSMKEEYKKRTGNGGWKLFCTIMQSLSLEHINEKSSLSVEPTDKDGSTSSLPMEVYIISLVSWKMMFCSWKIHIN